MAVLSTISPIPKKKADATAWLARNLRLGHNLKMGASTKLNSAPRTFTVGGFAYVPNRVEPWTVVLEVNDKLVKLWDFEEGKDGNLESRGFMHSFVMPFLPNDTAGR
jgi:hypothetical protein